MSFIKTNKKLKMYKIAFSKLNTHVWLAGFVNIIGLSAQLYILISTHKSEGLSLVMCLFTLYIQFIYARLGQRDKNKSLMWCMYISFAVEMIIIIYTIYLRLS